MSIPKQLPNYLTVLRVILVPVFVIVMTVGISYPVVNIVAAAIFLITALTDMLDGKLARKYGLVSDFGKIMDPLADKFMVFASMIALLVADGFEHLRPVLLWATLIVILRELAVTSMRLIVSGKTNATGLAANILGKIKTVSQIVFIMTALLEPVLFGEVFTFASFLAEYSVLTYATMAFMTVMTAWSGINYIVGYAKLMK